MIISTDDQLNKHSNEFCCFIMLMEVKVPYEILKVNHKFE